ncbi:MAG: SO_0444 family Cu/Zn efflux transporter, partial [Desulfobacterales bacterium]
CGVLPAAVTLQKQGANKGAVTSFMISTPESGIDSIAITYALLDPIMTVARPVVAFFTAAIAGVAENLLEKSGSNTQVHPDLTCPVDQCCDGNNCRPEDHKRHHSVAEKLGAGVRYAFTDFWNDLAGWFFIGLLAAGLIAVLVPEEMVKTYLGSGLPAMLFMLAVGIPLYICATASTPIAAALILKGVSPGAALVFLLAGPATNVAALTVMAGIIGKRATVIYLVAIGLSTVVFGLILDQVYSTLGVSAQAVVSGTATTIPEWVEVAGALILILLSLPLFFRKTLGSRRSGRRHIGRPTADRANTRPMAPSPDEPVCGPT